MIHDLATAAGLAFFLFGLFVFFSAVLGLFRFDYVLNRMHAAAVGDSLGIFCVLIGLMLLHGWSLSAAKTLLEYGFNVFYGKNVFKIVDQYQEKNMLLGILLLDRRRKKVILRVIIDHRLSQDLVLFISFCRGEMVIHERGDLIHIQVDVRDLAGLDVVYFIQTF